MKAIVCRELSGIDGLTLEEIPAPMLATGQVRIQVRACGVNFADSLITRGQYQVQPQPPFSPGFEVAGDGFRSFGVPGQGHGGGIGFWRW